MPAMKISRTFLFYRFFFFFDVFIFLVPILAGKIQVYCVQHHKDRDPHGCGHVFANTSILRLRRTHHNLKEYEWRWMRCLDLKDWNCEELLLMYTSNVCMDVVQVAWFQPSAVSCSSSVLVFLCVLHRRSKDGFDRAWYGCAQWRDFSWSSHRSSA